MEFSFGTWDGSLRLGLKARGRFFETLDLTECFLLSPETPRLLESVRAWALRTGLPPYDPRSHKGFLRNLIVREARGLKNPSSGPGERMVGIVTAPGEFPSDSFLECVGRGYPAFSVWRGIHSGVSDTAASDAIECLAGPPAITEVLQAAGRRLSFRISPYSFFQTNSGAAEILYSLLAAWVRESEVRTALDAFSGAGAIALSLSDALSKVWAIEASAAAVADARENARLNGIGNVSFYQGPCEILLGALLDCGPELAVIDPPRAGLMPRTLKALLSAPPRAAIYVSCNPKTLVRDLEALGSRYSCRRAALIDMFPHTEHIEAVVLLERK